MQEHQHVKTTPGEPVAPEVVVNPDPEAQTHGEDINVPLVAVTVAFFAVFLAVLIISLQAWVYSQAAAEVVAKQVPQGAPGTALGDELAVYQHELHDPAGWNDHAGYGEAQKVRRIPIEQAIQDTVKKYAGLQSPEPSQK